MCRTNQEPIELEIRRKWSWITPSLKKPTRHTTRQALTWNPEQKEMGNAERHLVRRSGSIDDKSKM